MATSNKQPPLLEGEDVYENWKQDVEMWSLFTDLSEEKKGPAVFLTLPPNIRECVRELPTSDIGGRDGLKILIKKLDDIYLKDEHTRAYMTFKEFYTYKRSSGTSINDFLVRYEFLYQRLKKFYIILPEGVQAFLVLNAVNISEENEKLARTTCSVLTYQNMKESIKKVFGDIYRDENVPAVKSEPEIVNYNYSKPGNNKRRFRRGQSNPCDRSGNVLLCYKCQSPNHLIRECPRNTPRFTEATEQIHITLFIQENIYLNSTNEKISNLVKETFGMAVLDSACTRTLAGEVWLDVYLDTLNESDLQLVKYTNSDRSFCFGDGVAVTAIKVAKFPVTLGGIRVYIEADIVKNDLPLLLSHKSMKTAGIVLDFRKDMCWIFDKCIELKTTTSGHYCLPLTNKLLDHSGTKNIVLHVQNFGQCSFTEKKKKAEKLHRQFAHASKEKLVSLVKKSGKFNDKEFIKAIEEVCENCQICLRFKKAPLRPVVGLPLGNRFNHTVCMDLKEFIHNEVWILHLIDAATRYSAATLIKTKKKEEIIKNIFMMWITYFGSPVRFLSDNGGEFNNEHYRQMNEKLNIETCTTAAESPFSNGTVERHNLIVAEAMKKTIDDEKCEPEIALAWAICAKNALLNYSGHSPNELVFGFNVNTPSILTDQLPAMESSTTSDMVRKNLNALHSARRNFLEAESSERIRRALRSNVRTYADEDYATGDQIYYRRQGFKGWRGPAKVLGREGQFVLIRHGGAFYRMHPCQLMKVNKNNEKRTKKAEMLGNTTEGKNEYLSVEEEELQNQVVESEDIDREEVVDSSTSLRDKTEKPGRNKTITYKINGSEEWKKGKVMSVQPKSTGKYSHWINIEPEDENEDQVCINWNHIDHWREVPQYTEQENVVLLTAEQEQSKAVMDAKHKEIKNMNTYEVFECVPYTGQKTISTRWVITEKFKDNQKTMKARLVARGYEENSNLKTDSPTCSREAMRMVMLTASIKNWMLQTIDFTSAFLQGGILERDVYLRPPSDVCPKSQVWKLKRCIYGLNDAPRAWYKRVTQALIELKGVASAYDNALFLWHDIKGNLTGILAMHVDDFVFCGNTEFERDVIATLKEKFKVGSHESGTFKYVGLNVNQQENGITVEQDLYVSSISPIEISKGRILRKNDELNEEEKHELKRLAGQMMWVSTQTRPDIAFDVCKMSNTGKHPKVKALFEANKALSKLKSKKGSITFPKLGKPSDLHILCYTDASYASLEDGSSQGGFVVFIGGSTDKMAPMCWASKKLDRVTKSPLASETLALNEGADAGVLTAVMIQEVFQLSKLPDVLCKTDNASLVETLNSNNLVSDRRLRIDVARLKEMKSRGEIQIEWIKGCDQVSDCLTKAGASSELLRDLLNQK